MNLNVEPWECFGSAWYLRQIAAAPGTADAGYREQLLLAFTVNAAALFVPTIAMVALKNVNTDAAFWSISLALLTVVSWHGASVMTHAPVFRLDPLWPGLMVSTLLFSAISLTKRKQA